MVPFRSLRRSIRTRSRRYWRTGCSSTPNVQPRAPFMRRTFASPTSTARNARCRSSFGWVNTPSIGMEITATTTARALRSQPTQPCQSIPLGQDNAAQVDSIDLASGQRASVEWRNRLIAPLGAHPSALRPSCRAAQCASLIAPAPVSAITAAPPRADMIRRGSPLAKPFHSAAAVKIYQFGVGREITHHEANSREEGRLCGRTPAHCR